MTRNSVRTHPKVQKFEELDGSHFEDAWPGKIDNLTMSVASWEVYSEIVYNYEEKIDHTLRFYQNLRQYGYWVDQIKQCAIDRGDYKGSVKEWIDKVQSY